MTIASVAVLGAGTMGAQLAAHAANAGLPVRLFDVTADAARLGLDRLKTLKPDPFFTRGAADRIQAAGFDRLADLSQIDWIIEAVVEDLEVKRDLLRRVASHASPDALFSSNTSGIPISAIAGALQPDARRRLVGTHFFNPPRYLHLVELIATPDTNPALVHALAAFLDVRLGKGVVFARDTPGFIANRLGVFGAIRALDLVATGEYSIEEIDAATGPLIGRPKSATFRTLDIAGLDVFAVVARDLAARVGSSEQAAFALPAFVTTMVERGWLGEKSGKGFYTRTKTGGSETRVLSLDIQTFEHRAGPPVAPPALQSAPSSRSSADRVRELFLGSDRTGDLLRRTLGPTLVYAASIAPEIARSIDDVDRAMRWGFGWALGPFELWDAIGVRTVVGACGVTDLPPAVKSVLDAGRDRFRDAPLAPAGPGLRVLQSAKHARPPIRTNAGASLVDLGDGVLCVEFHSKLNTIGGDTLEMLRAGLAAAANATALVIGSEADTFSAGANLMLLLLHAQEGEWDEIDQMVRAFQRTTMAIKTSPVPVVAAPAGLALGGGCEICLHADRVQAAAETYIGLVEAGVGLIPAGGGTKEMLLRAIDRAGAHDAGDEVRAVFEVMARGTVATSADDARRLGYRRDVDGCSMNRERVIGDAKAVALDRARGYRPAVRRTAIPIGGADQYALLALGLHLAHRAGHASDHDVLVGRALARVITGGDVPHRATVSEDHLLDLEREAFLRLCGERKTLERIGYTLKSGKTLRN